MLRQKHNRVDNLSFEVSVDIANVAGESGPFAEA